MPRISLADDETPIKVLPDIPNWCENYAWAGYDPVSGIGHYFSLGRWIGDLRLWRSVINIALPGGRVLTSKNFGYGNDNGPASAELSYTVIEPKKRFRLAFDGVSGSYESDDLSSRGFHESKQKRLQFTFDFVSDEPVWDIGGDAKESAIIVGAGHVEQQGIVTGSLKYGDEEFRLSPSVVTRDHSRGPRDFRPYRRHCWNNGSFPSGLRFYSYYFEVKSSPEGEAMQLAAISKDGKLYPATIRPEWFDRHRRPTRAQSKLPFRIKLESELGVMLLTGTPLNTMCISTSFDPFDCHLGFSEQNPFDSLLFFEQSVEWHLDGELGYGHTERGIEPQT